MGPVQKLVAAFQAILGPVNRLPSWANEALAAVVLMPVLYFFFEAPGFIGFEVGSAVYEWWRWPRLDPNGYSAEDVGQRSVAAVAALLAMLLLHGLLGVPKLWFIVAGAAGFVGAWEYARKRYPA